jgi:hypothetical protein
VDLEHAVEGHCTYPDPESGELSFSILLGYRVAAQGFLALLLVAD